LLLLCVLLLLLLLLLCVLLLLLCVLLQAQQCMLQAGSCRLTPLQHTSAEPQDFTEWFHSHHHSKQEDHMKL
jgi:hypothetical protein